MLKESEESEVEYETGPTSSAAATQLLHDSLLEEEEETSRSFVVNTTPVFDTSPNREYMQVEETTLVQKFLADGCGCDLATGGCSSNFSTESLMGYRNDCLDLMRAELDMVFLGQLAAFTNTSTHTVHSIRDTPHGSVQRQKHTGSSGMVLGKCARKRSSCTLSLKRGFETCKRACRKMGWYQDSMATCAAYHLIL